MKIRELTPEQHRAKEEERTRIIKLLVGKGVDYGDAMIVWDMANHASEQAQITWMNVIETAPLHTRGFILPLAANFLECAMKEVFDQMLSHALEGIVKAARDGN